MNKCSVCETYANQQKIDELKLQIEKLTAAIARLRVERWSREPEELCDKHDWRKARQLRKQLRLEELARQLERQRQAFELRAAGKSWVAVGKALGISGARAAILGKREQYRREEQVENQAPFSPSA